MFDLVYDFCVFVVRQLDPVLSIGAFYKLPMSDIRPTDQPMGECSVLCVFAVIRILRRFSSFTCQAYDRHIACNL